MGCNRQMAGRRTLRVGSNSRTLRGQSNEEERVSRKKGCRVPFNPCLHWRSDQTLADTLPFFIGGQEVRHSQRHNAASLDRVWDTGSPKDDVSDQRGRG